MKKILIAILIFFFPLIVLAAPAYVQDISGRGASPKALTFGSNTIAGNLIVVYMFTESNSDVLISTVTDSQGNTFHFINRGTANATQFNTEEWYASNIIGGADTITITAASAVTIDANITEFSGVNTLDTSNGYTGGTPDNNPSIALTTSVNNELLTGIIVSASGNPSAGSGFVGRTNTGNGFAAFYLPEDSNGTSNTAGSNPVTFTVTASFNGGVAAAFKQVNNTPVVGPAIMIIRSFFKVRGFLTIR